MRLTSQIVITLLCMSGSTASHACDLTARIHQVGRASISYYRVGAGPYVLLLHGLFAEKEQWNGLACQLASSGFTVIAVDLPGYGRSTGFELPDYRLERQVELLHDFVKQLGITRLHVAGNSMGGTIASLYAISYPGEVESAAFLGAPFGIVSWSQEFKDDIYRGLNPFIPTTAASLDLELQMLFVQPPALSAARIRSIAQKYELRFEHYVQVWDIVSLYDDILMHVAFARIPTLVIWGSADRIFPVAGSYELLQLIPQVDLHVLPGAGHLLHVENGDEVAPIYASFLRRVAH